MLVGRRLALRFGLRLLVRHWWPSLLLARLSPRLVGRVKPRGGNRDSGRVDALKHALGANAIHGLPMKRGNVKRAVELAVKTWPNKSQQEIAEQVGCTKQYVGQLKAEISKQVYLPPTRTDSIGRTRPTSYATRKPTTPEGEEARTYGDVRRRQPRRRDGVREVVGVRHGRGLDTGAGVRIL